jgi:hypothetical protein
MEDFRQGWKATTKLIEYLERSREKINWHKTAYRDGTFYDSVPFKENDTTFSSTTYKACLQNERISLEHFINWNESWNKFSLSFTERADLDLIPHPKGFVIHSCSPQDPYRLLPNFCAIYGCYLLLEASTALTDFMENGERLITFGNNMSPEAIVQYRQLINQFRVHKDHEILSVG